jgi:hypothetical protein
MKDDHEGDPGKMFIWTAFLTVVTWTVILAVVYWIIH